MLNTPIYNFLMSYAERDVLRCHMPGHKGRSCYGAPERFIRLDITEISGADSLLEADGIIAESEHNMTELYHTAGTVYSTGGSTLCIQTMLALMKQENRKIFAVRNVHRAFLNAAALLDLDVEWIVPQYSGGILSGEIPFDEIEASLSRCGKPSCLYVTSPDYTGKITDIRTLSEICRRHDARLIVDNAHGTHLAFFKKSLHPIALGADLCCDSAHKLLPALTGAAMLHAASIEYAAKLKQTMSLFASTSPSYLIMASLDLCAKYIYEEIRHDIAENIRLIQRLKENLCGELVFADGEPFHITIKAAENGYNGNELVRRLRESGVECEYSDNELVILLMSPVNSAGDYLRLETSLEKAVRDSHRTELHPETFYLPEPQKVMSIREAVFAPSEEICVDNAAGRICGAVSVPCPPAVPIAVSGEIITQEHINIFKRYGIPTVNVVK